MVSRGQLEPGTLLSDRYRIVRRIGGGGMGNVYLAQDTRLNNKERAVKEMMEVFSDDTQHKKAIEDFKREAELLASLEHPSIPTIYDYFVSDNGRYYLVMKYIRGGDLSGYIKQSCPVEEKKVVEWAIQVCDVLNYIHSQDPPIIYRDLKPANLMLDDSIKPARIMLIDFGIARFVSPMQKGVTAIGTMGYAPPELFSGKVKPNSDIYSLGATIFYLLTGVDPQDNPLLIFDFTKNPKPRQINPLLTSGIDSIITRAVEYETISRFSSALEMKQALESHLSQLNKLQINQGIEFNPSYVSIENTKKAFCSNCGQTIAIEDYFCPYCGIRQLPVSNKSNIVVGKLILVEPANTNTIFVIDKDTNLVGRNDPHTGIFPEVDLTSFDNKTKVSRRHARIYRKGSQTFVEDLSSVNGTFINGSIKLYPKQPYLLQEGDTVRFGETTLKFVVG